MLLANRDNTFIKNWEIRCRSSKIEKLEYLPRIHLYEHVIKILAWNCRNEIQNPLILFFLCHLAWIIKNKIPVIGFLYLSLLTNFFFFSLWPVPGVLLPSGYAFRLWGQIDLGEDPASLHQVTFIKRQSCGRPLPNVKYCYSPYDPNPWWTTSETQESPCCCLMLNRHILSIPLI